MGRDENGRCQPKAEGPALASRNSPHRALQPSKQVNHAELTSPLLQLCLACYTQTYPLHFVLRCPGLKWAHSKEFANPPGMETHAAQVKSAFVLDFSLSDPREKRDCCTQELTEFLSSLFSEKITNILALLCEDKSNHSSSIPSFSGFLNQGLMYPSLASKSL